MLNSMTNSNPTGIEPGESSDYVAMLSAASISRLGYEIESFGIEEETLVVHLTEEDLDRKSLRQNLEASIQECLGVIDGMLKNSPTTHLQIHSLNGTVRISPLIYKEQFLPFLEAYGSVVLARDLVTESPGV